jgi:hypothetical protein
MGWKRPTTCWRGLAHGRKLARGAKVARALDGDTAWSPRDGLTRWRGQRRPAGGRGGVRPVAQVSTSLWEFARWGYMSGGSPQGRRNGEAAKKSSPTAFLIGEDSVVVGGGWESS